MKIILATGIYPPDIGGPATYVAALAERLTKGGHTVEVVTFGKGMNVQEGSWTVHTVSRSVPVLRWWWYSQKLQQVSSDADMVYAFSSISCGIPVILAGLRCKKVLRLGGDFFWERYTDMGGGKSLRDWYASSHPSRIIGKPMMGWILNRFHALVFSTDFQKKLYAEMYSALPQSSVIENALSLEHVTPMVEHFNKDPFRLLFVGRFVGFKNLSSLIEAVAQIPDAYLTLVGDGPLDDSLRTLVERLGLTQRVQFVSPQRGSEKFAIFEKHNLLVLPSLTEISPNTALEARSVGLPVLLTEETGLSDNLRSGIVTEDLSTPGKIVEAIARVRQGYSLVAEAASKKIDGRNWEEVTEETLDFFGTITHQ